jgi:hypothetical protein
MADVSTYAVQGLATAQEAIDRAELKGREYHDLGYDVGPPWYLPQPVPGSYPLRYTYEGRVWYGRGPTALLNRFYSHLYELEEDAVAEALDAQEALEEAGYEVGSVGSQVREFEGRSYYETVFYFGMPGAVIPEPFAATSGSHWLVWLLPAGLVLGVVAMVIVKARR